MGAQRGANRPLQVEQVRRALLRDYDGLIYDDDLKGYDQDGREQRFLSRALAAAAVRLSTGCDFETAGRAVIDGENDQGIDAVAVSENSRDVWLVQAKWSDTGKGKLDQNAARALVDGLRLIERREFVPPFNDRMTPFTSQLDAAMGDPRLRITLVIAVMGEGVLSDAVVEVLDRARSEFGGGYERLGHRVYGAADFHRQAREDLTPPPVDVEATMTGWIRREMPFPAWQGTVAARDVERWYAEHADALYEQNVRKSLGLTRTNSGIKETLLNEPENFWYFNNGITVLCDEIVPHYPGRRRPDEPVVLTMKGVSIVNGAQTVTAIHEAMSVNAERVEEADVTVRAISLGADRAAYANRITETTNTQNDVSQRDFIALEPAQAQIREDFLLTLERIYTYKRGEPPLASPEAGCSVEVAAEALACAHRTPELAVRAALDTNLLWERGADGAYPRLFGEVPSAYRIWRLVEVRRAVGTSLYAHRKKLRGRAADIARRGEMLVVHIVMQLLDHDELDEPGYEWQPVLDGVPGKVDAVLPWLVHHVDAQFGKNSFLTTTFSDEGRCKDLAKLVLDGVRSGGIVPELPGDYRPSAQKSRRQRRPNAVPTIVNAGRLADGEPLTYSPYIRAEAEAVKGWLAEDPRRAQATWVNDRRKCLLWAYDGEAYSATGLVHRIWELSDYEKSPVSVQGPGRWKLDSGQSLWDLAVQLFGEQTDEG
ncbi:hypothetical protein GCM10010182_40890 [Actinomadura cremea]|nr:hypothetical protein GCM10010182_40890 [Actinomadura cremea]